MDKVASVNPVHMTGMVVLLLLSAWIKTENRKLFTILTSASSVLSGLKMSKRELNKWKNKLKLYLIFHPDKAVVAWGTCHVCKYRGVSFEKCPWPTVMVSKTKPLQMKERTYDDSGKFFENWWCVEWIKHV